YAQEVEGVRRDVTLANLSLMGTKWHLRQLHRRLPDPFDPRSAAALWRGSDAHRPEFPALAIDDTAIDSLPAIRRVKAESHLQVGSIQVVFGNSYLLQSDLATILLIRDNLGRRPIYFGWGDGSYPDQVLGLGPYLVTQGMVRKLMPAPIEQSDSVPYSREIGF